MRLFQLIMVVALLVSACGGSDTVEPQVVPDERTGATDPELAVSGIIRAIESGDSAVLDSLTLTDQLGLVALVEGANPSEAEAALGFASEQIAATFWASFASGIEDFLDAGVDDIRIGDVETVDVPGARYATVDVEFPLDSANRVFVVTDQDGWRVDLIATFPAAFLSSIPFAAERAASPGVAPELVESIRVQTGSLDAIEAIGVTGDLAGALIAARAAITP